MTTLVLLGSNESNFFRFKRTDLLGAELHLLDPAIYGSSDRRSLLSLDSNGWVWVTNAGVNSIVQHEDFNYAPIDLGFD